MTVKIYARCATRCPAPPQVVALESEELALLNASDLDARVQLLVELSHPCAARQVEEAR